MIWPFNKTPSRSTLLRENERLRGIVSALPTTSDGVPIVEGHNDGDLHCLTRMKSGRVLISKHCYADLVDWLHEGIEDDKIDFVAYYSNRQAAENVGLVMAHLYPLDCPET